MSPATGRHPALFETVEALAREMGEETAAGVVGLFLSHGEVEIRHLAWALGWEPDSVAQRAHGLRRHCSTLAAVSLSALCGELGSRARVSRPALLIPLIEQLRAEFSNLCAALEPWVLERRAAS